MHERHANAQCRLRAMMFFWSAAARSFLPCGVVCCDPRLPHPNGRLPAAQRGSPPLRRRGRPRCQYSVRPALSAARRVRSVVRHISACGKAMAASRKQHATERCVALRQTKENSVKSNP